MTHDRHAETPLRDITDGQPARGEYDCPHPVDMLTLQGTGMRDGSPVQTREGKHRMTGRRVRLLMFCSMRVFILAWT